MKLEGMPEADLQLAVDELKKLDRKSIKQFMKGSPVVEKDDLLKVISKIFNIS